MGKRTLLLAAVQFLWELARFLGLFALALLRFQAAVLGDAVHWLLALFLYNPDGRATLLPFLRLAKILQVFPVLLLSFVLALRPGPALSALQFVPPRLALLAG